MRHVLVVRVSLVLVLVFTVIPVIAETSTIGLPVATSQPLSASDEETVTRVDPGQIEFTASWTCDSLSSCDGNIAHNISDIYPAGTVTFVTASATRGNCAVVTSIRVECDFGTVVSGDRAVVTMSADYSGEVQLFVFDYETASGFDMDRMMIIDPYVTGVDLVTNGGFETVGSQKSIPQSWKVKNLAKRKCNKDDKIISFEGDCVVQMKGIAGIKSKLIQDVTVPAGISGQDAFWVETQINAKNLAKSPVLMVKWDAGSFGTARAKLTLPVSSDGYTLVNRQAKFYGAPTGIKVQLTCKGASGKVFVDQVRLYYVDRSVYF